MKFIVYVAILLAAAAGLALGLDLLTRPSAKLEATTRQPLADVQKADVRKIPIVRAAATEHGDPNNQLTPVYPASPGKDLPVQKTPVIAAAPPGAKAPAETNGNAPASPTDVKEKTPVTASAPPLTEEKAASVTPASTTPASTTPASATTASAAPNSCNVQACSAAYRSFRASDCSYQPFSGERKFCDASPGEPGQTTASRALGPEAPAPAQAAPDRRERSAQTPNIRQNARQNNRDEDDLDDAIRTVRSLPQADRDDDGAVEMVEPSYGERSYGEPYGGGRRWIIERR